MAGIVDIDAQEGVVRLRYGSGRVRLICKATAIDRRVTNREASLLAGAPAAGVHPTVDLAACDLDIAGFHHHVAGEDASVVRPARSDGRRATMQARSSRYSSTARIGEADA